MVRKPILTVDKPHFVVKLYEDLLEVDLKEGARKELEDVAEAYPVFRESLGVLFQTIIPLDVALCDVDCAEVDSKGRLKVVVPLRRDIVIPLEPSESEKLAEKLNELIPMAKLKDAEKTGKLGEAEAGFKPKPTKEI